MASGLQCPGCGHVHPAGLPEIVRGDATFRCYGCYRTLSIPEGWTGRPALRTPAAPVPTADAPPGAGLRDARASRLAGRRGARSGSGFGFDEPTQMVPLTGAEPEGRPPGAAGPAPNWPAAGATGGWAGAAGAAAPGSAGVADARTAAGVSTGGLAGVRPGAPAGSAAGPLGWVTPRRSGRPLPAPVRALIWVAALGVSLLVSAYLLEKINVLGVNTALELFAGTGPRRFGILLVMLPLWALLSATIAHFSLEALTRRRRTRDRARARRTPSDPAEPPGVRFPG